MANDVSAPLGYKANGQPRQRRPGAGAVARVFLQTGQTFGRLKVIDPEVRDARGERSALCECQCPDRTIRTVPIRALTHGITRSCGCLQREAASRTAAAIGPEARRKGLASPKRKAAQLEWARSAENAALLLARATTHGLSGHPLFDTWRKMMARCYDPKAFGYHNYGGRGIRVCAEWHDLAAFIDWIEANIGPRPPGTTGRTRRRPTFTLDRIDNDGNYEPGNVRWADPKQQLRNRRSNGGWTLADAIRYLEENGFYLR